MNTLGMLLTSAGQTEVLRTLMCHSKPISLRQVSRIAGVYPHAAERVLAPLVRKDLVTLKHSPARSLYSLNRSHADVLVLASVFSAATTGFINARSQSLGKRAKSILPFISEASRMIARARKSRHVA
ncbi:MAG: hypothetical protein WCI20_10360 [bacterium]